MMHLRFGISLDDLVYTSDKARVGTANLAPKETCTQQWFKRENLSVAGCEASCTGIALKKLPQPLYDRTVALNRKDIKLWKKVQPMWRQQLQDILQACGMSRADFDEVVSRFKQ